LPGVSDGDDATIWSLLVAQLEHRYARGQHPGDQLGNERDADARRDAGEFPDPLRVLDKASAPSLGFPHDLLRRETSPSARTATNGASSTTGGRHRRSTYL
jgi:hypothetical protein